MANGVAKEELAKEFDETKELIDLLNDDNLVDIESLLDNIDFRDKDRYMNAPVRLKLPNELAVQPGVKVFVDQVSGLPRLNFRGQRDAKAKIENGDRQALEELIITGLPWIFRIAEKYGKACPYEFLDYVQEGVFGLVEAIRRWDPEKGALATYAASWINQRISRYIAEVGSTLRHPVHLFEERKRIVAQIRKTGRMPSDVKSTDLAAWLPPVSLNSDLSWVLSASIKDQALRQKESPLPPGQYIFEDIPDTYSFEDDTIDRLYLEQVRKWFNELDISERQRFVLVNRYGLNSDGRKKTLGEVGKLLGLTRERVRQIEAKAIKRLRHPSRSRAIKVLDRPEKPIQRMEYRPPKPGYVKNERVAVSVMAGKNSRENDLQENDLHAVQAVFSLFNRPVISERDLVSALEKVDVAKLRYFWKDFWCIPAVQEALTRKQKMAIGRAINNELAIGQQTIGFMKRGLVRFFRRFLVRHH